MYVCSKLVLPIRMCFHTIVYVSVLSTAPRAKAVVSEEEGPLSISLAMQLHVTHSKLQMYSCAAIANVMFGGKFCSATGRRPR